MAFAIVFLFGVICGALLSYHLAGVAALKKKIAEIDRQDTPDA